MNCNETLELLNSLVDNELLPVEAEAVKNHLQHCGKCRHEFEQTDDLHKTLSKVARYTVPDSLAIQISKQIAGLEEKQPAVRNWNRWVTLAATHAAAALLGVAIYFSISSFLDNSTAMQDDIIAVHVRSLMEQNLAHVSTSDSHTLQPWFAGKIDYAPSVHDLEIDGFPLIGGRVDQLNGRKVAVLVYQRRKHLINLFIEIATVDTPQAEFVRWGRRGYHVVTTQQGDFVYSAVSDLSTDELEEFLQLIQAKN